MTPFLKYLGELLENEDALLVFLEDPIRGVKVQNAKKDDDGTPITETDENGNETLVMKDPHEQVNKTERAILRRTLATASTNTPNGYALIRPTDSYRRAIHMLKNVLHTHHGTGVAQGTHASSDVPDGETTRVLSIFVNGNPSDPTSGDPYAQLVLAVGTARDSDTLQTFMDGAKYKNINVYPPLEVPIKGNYGTVTNEDGTFVNSFTIPQGFGATPGTYNVPLPSKADFKNQADVPFWFYSFGGRGTQGPTRTGSVGESFTTVQLGSDYDLYWQVIAPKISYGYHRCYKPEPKNPMHHAYSEKRS